MRNTDFLNSHGQMKFSARILGSSYVQCGMEGYMLHKNMKNLIIKKPLWKKRSICEFLTSFSKFTDKPL